MDLRPLLDALIGSAPMIVAALVGLALLLAWQAFAPARGVRHLRGRLDSHMSLPVDQETEEMSKPLRRRVLLPMLQGLVQAAGRLIPLGNVEKLEQTLIQAGRPGNLSPLDFSGLRLLAAVFLGVFCYLIVSKSQASSIAMRYSLVASAAGYMLPSLWLGSRVKRRKNDMLRALPDALDMLTIGVEAGLSFEAAMLKVAERWKNALTLEFRRAVGEMRMGTGRDEALQRLSDRSGVKELATFVAILIHSSQMGVSIAQVLHSQAAQMRIRRRQRAEELARQAGIKMIFPLGTLILPALFVVILGPAVPIILGTFSSVGGG
jgi:tight adherence protein C